MWRWAKDKWTSQEHTWDIFGYSLLSHDKIAHFLGGWLLFPLLAKYVGILTAIAISLGFWWLWEVKDALVPYEKVGWLGGDGFSWKDGLAATLGIGLSVILTISLGMLVGLLSGPVLVVAAMLIRPKHEIGE